MEKRTARLEAFSDGIFAVAITLLAIEIGIAEYHGATNQNLWECILEKWPDYFAYFNSFATVLLIWMGHHKMINKLRVANHWIILSNGLVLLLVALFPYPTKLVSAFIRTDAVNTAVSVYASFTGVIVISMAIFTKCLTRHKKLLINSDKNLPWFRDMFKGQVIGITVYTIAAVVAFLSPAISLGLTFLMWIFWAMNLKDTNDDFE